MYQGGNYNGKQPNSSSYIKNFISGIQSSLWKQISYKDTINNLFINAITPSSPRYDNVYIPGNLYVDGIILNPSDVYLKDKIEDLNKDVSNNLMNIRPTQFIFKSDPFKKKHYGFIAQEIEEHFPELVSLKIDKDIANSKAINYLEMVPLLVHQIQKMQKEIDELKNK
jgi:hypothetical protein